MATGKLVPIVCGKDGKVHIATDGTWCPICGIDNTHKHAVLSGNIVEFKGTTINRKESDE